LTHATDSLRLRFAPSPTGWLHLGNARTALFNWLTARGRGGTFVLRIEDTDRERSTAESEASILDDLRWLGLDWDEGVAAGGDAAPYRQSEAGDIYRAAIGDLLARGVAYPCFCSREELDAERAEQTTAGHGRIGYSGRCRTIAPADADRRIADGASHVWRLRFPADDKTVAFDDLVRGRVSFQVSTLGGDMILVRADGTPTYQFAVVVDDHRMGITHVLRGEDHLTNTPKQMLLFEAFGWTAPRYGHMAMILGPDRSKLSKRHGSVNVRQFRDEGVLPEALFNALALLGWSPGDDREVFRREELIAAFSLDRLVPSAGVFDIAKLHWLNGQHIRALTPATFATTALAWLTEHHADAVAAVDRQALAALLPLLQEKIETLSQLLPLLSPLRAGLAERNADVEAVLAMETVPALLDTVDGALADVPAPGPERDAWFSTLMAKAKEQPGAKGRLLFQPLRLILTGTPHGPDLGPLVACIPTDILRARPKALRALLEEIRR
jgi:nondiscriminating glutamyl-tRNA synthetase